MKVWIFTVINQIRINKLHSLSILMNNYQDNKLQIVLKKSPSFDFFQKNCILIKI